MSCIWKILLILGVIINTAIKINALNSQNSNLYFFEDATDETDSTDETEEPQEPQEPEEPAPIDDPGPICEECQPGTDSCIIYFNFFIFVITNCLLKQVVKKRIVQLVHV